MHTKGDLFLFISYSGSVMMSSMAQQFGIPIALLDRELSRFIASGRLNAKIDKVGDIIETRRPDRKNRQYQEVIKKGDALLNQIQKLARVVQM
jgi:26S proteasome regulatory subunit N7